MRKYAALTIVLSIFATTVNAASFSDTNDTVYKDAYAYLSSKGVVQGYSDGSGRPYQTLNRAEAVKVIMLTQSNLMDRVKKAEKNSQPVPLFSDTEPDAWYIPYIEAGVEAGIVHGHSDGTFRPADQLKVEEALALLLRSYGEDDESVSEASDSNYIENDSGQWFTGYINAAIGQNLAMHAGRLYLGHPITRGQFFDMVYRKMSNTEKRKGSFTEPQWTVEQLLQLEEQLRGQSDPAASSYGSEQYFAISMPTLGIKDLTISHPTDPFTNDGIMEPLQIGVGHLFSYPGDGGKIMVYGHSSGYPWDVSQYTKIFRKINGLQPGDEIYVTYDGKMYTYEVSFEETVQASDGAPFEDNGDGGEELILYTCWPPDSISQRYLVHAVPVRSVAVR